MEDDNLFHEEDDHLFNEEEREIHENQNDDVQPKDVEQRTWEHDLLPVEEWIEAHNMLYDDEEWIEEDEFLYEDEWIEERIFDDVEEWERAQEESYHQELQLQDHKEREYQMLLAASTGSLNELIEYKRILEYSNPNIVEIAYDEKWGYTVLHMASKGGHLHLVKYLVEECNMSYDTIGNNKQQSTALQVACSYGHLPIVEYFIDHCNADINETNYYGDTLLHRAICNGHLNVVRYLVQDFGHIIDIEQKSNVGLTAFHTAVVYSKLNIVQFLSSECQVNVEAKTNHGWTPLHIAILFHSKMSTVQYLIDMCHVDITATNDQDVTIFDILFYIYRKRRNVTDYCNDIVVYLLQTMITRGNCE